MAALTRVPFDDPSEFLARLRQSNDAWWKNGSRASSWVFRGVGDADNWRLVPSAWRKTQNRLHPLIVKIKAAELEIECDNGLNLIARCYFEWQAAEREALFQFAERANAAGFRVNPKAYSKECSPLAMRRAQNFTFPSPPPDIELMALAQHHSIPTRLLDWSENPMVAAFFAAFSSAGREDARNICVWALDTSCAQQAENRGSAGRFRLRLHTPSRSENLYLHSQEGVLTELLDAEKHFFEYDDWPSLEDAFEGMDSAHPVLIGHTLDIEHVPRLLTLLEREGVNSAMLMPSLDHVSKSVMAGWKITD